jgi:RHS repeat-associated protein
VDTQYVTNFAPYYILDGLINSTEHHGIPATDRQYCIVTSYSYIDTEHPDRESPDQPYAVTDPYCPAQLANQTTLDPFGDTGVVKRYSKYDSEGRQLESWYAWEDPADSDTIVDRYVFTVTTYDKQGRVTKTERIVDDQFPYASQLNQRISTVCLSQTTYNSIGKPDTTEDENHIVTKYWYDETGNLVETEVYAVYDRETPANNVMLSTTRTLFDADGRAIVTVGPYAAGQTPVGTETVYDALGRVSQTNRWANAVVQLSAFAVDDEGHLIAASQAHPAVGENATGWTKGSLLSSTSTEYDAAGRVYRSLGPTSNAQGLICTQEIRYDAAGRQVEVISLPDDAANKAVTETHYDGPRQDWTQDARGNVTSFEYDDLGRVVKTIHPATAYKVIGTGDAIQSASGPVYSHVGYDGFGRKAWETPGPVAAASADDIPDNQRKWYWYDVAGRLTKVKMPAVDPATGVCPVYRYYYDAYGNQIGILDPLGRVTVMEYDSQNRPVKKYQPYQVTLQVDLSDVTVFPTWSSLVSARPGNQPFEGKSYNPLGRIRAEQDYAGNLTAYWYYAASDTGGRAGQLSYKRHYKNNSPAGQTPTWDYNGDHPTKGANPEIHYTYDTLGRTHEEIVKAYNATGADGTLIDGPNTWTTHYDNEGRVSILESPQGDLLYQYDSRTGNKTAATSYPAAMSPEQIRTDAAATPTPYLASTTRTVYTYDDLGRLYKVQVIRRNGVAVNEDPTTYRYNKVGSQEKVIYPDTNLDGDSNGNEAVYEYDALNRLVRLTNYKDSGHVEGQLLSRFEYSCYANGQRATAVETRTGWIWTGSGNSRVNSQYGYPTRQIAYQYDGLGRLKWEQRNGNDPNEFAYDLVGNRFSRTLENLPGPSDDVTTYYFYDSRDRLEKESLNANGTPATITYGYDANGSLTSQTTFGSNGLTAETVVYEYNLSGRLKQVTTTPYNTNGTAGTPIVTQYAYDPSGNRVRKQVGTGTPTSYLVDPTNPTGYSQVLQETTGSTVTAYILGADVIGQSADTAGPEYLLYDGHGSVRNHANASGDLIWYDIPGYAYHTDHPTEDYTLFSYDAWGADCRRPSGDGLYYSGEQYDSALKMYNLRARYYNPANGRFNALDPYAGSSYDPQSLHKYLYCHADPINGIDPSGWQTTMVEVTTATIIQAVIRDIAVSGLLLQALHEANRNFGNRIPLLEEIEGRTTRSMFEYIEQKHAYVQVAFEVRTYENMARQQAGKMGLTRNKVKDLPIFFVFESITPHIYNLDKNAIATHPWWVALQYVGVGNANLINQNREAARAGWWHLLDVPRGLDSLDEYPFASTFQGGAGASINAVPRSEQNFQGGTLSGFYKSRLENLPRWFLVVPLPL